MTLTLTIQNIKHVTDVAYSIFNDIHLLNLVSVLYF
jgi:hypothetical protein